jgi:hypothetical protein
VQASDCQPVERRYALIEQIVIAAFGIAGTAFMLFVLVETQRDLNRAKKRSSLKSENPILRLLHKMGFATQGQGQKSSMKNSLAPLLQIQGDSSNQPYRTGHTQARFSQ